MLKTNFTEDYVGYETKLIIHPTFQNKITVIIHC